MSASPTSIEVQASEEKPTTPLPSPETVVETTTTTTIQVSANEGEENEIVVSPDEDTPLRIVVPDQLLEGLFDQMVAKLEEKSVSIEKGTLSMVLLYSMEFVEQTEHKGADKKTVALELMKRLIRNSSLEEGVRDYLLEITENGVLSAMIDTVIDVSKGKINLNKIVEEVTEHAEEVAQETAKNCIVQVFRVVRRKLAAVLIKKKVQQ